MVRLLARSGGWWIRSQREAFRSRGRELTQHEHELMGGFFEESLLAGVRIHRFEKGEIPAWFRVQRFAGITLDDTILLSPRAPVMGPVWSRLLFHELVHVVQFSALGVDEFARRYVTGWARNGFSYHRIPLETHVRELEARFAAIPLARFSVASEVSAWLAGFSPARRSG